MKTNTIDEAKLREILIPAFFPESGFDFKPNARTEKRIADMITAIQSLAAEAVEAELTRLTEWYNKDGSAEKSKGGYYNSYVKRRIAKVAEISKQTEVTSESQTPAGTSPPTPIKAKGGTIVMWTEPGFRKEIDARLAQLTEDSKES